MTQWIIDNWHAVAGWSVTTAILGIGTWISVHYGQLWKSFRWFQKQFYLRAENAILTQKIEEIQKFATIATSRAEKAEAENDILRKQLEPPDIELSEIKIIRLLAVRGYGISRGGLRTQTGLERTRGDYHINRLERTFHFIHERTFADARPPIYELTDVGKAYAVKNDLDKPQ